MVEVGRTQGSLPSDCRTTPTMRYESIPGLPPLATNHHSSCAADAHRIAASDEDRSHQRDLNGGVFDSLLTQAYLERFPGTPGIGAACNSRLQ